MRIRRSASRLLGSAVSPASDPALPGFELTPPPPPPAQESQASFVGASGTLEHCELSLSPWDLMDQLHHSDPQEEKIFFETYLVAVAWRTSWLFQPSMPAAGSIKEEEEQEDDMAASIIFGMQVCKNNAARKKAKNKKEMVPNLNKEQIKEGVSGAAAEGETPVWTCKKKNLSGGNRWSCWRPASQPNSFCSYHSDQKPKRKRATDVGEGFYYYAGFAPSRSTKRQRSMLEEPTLPAQDKKNAQLREDQHTHDVTRISSSNNGVPEPPSAGQKEEASPNPEEHIGFTKPQAAPPVHLDEPMSDDGTAGIAGYNEESSDDYVVKSRKIQLKSPLNKRWRKPVKARSLKSLMY